MEPDPLTRDDEGNLAAPSAPDSEAWDDWVSATRLRGYLLRATLSDWLEAYGLEKGFVRDTDLPGYDERLQFPIFIMQKGGEFEEAVVAHIRTFHEVEAISQDRHDVRDLGAARRTVEAMAAGRPILHQAVLWNAETRTYGVADFLARSDVFDELFPGHLPPGEASRPAPGIGAPWHYIVIDAKYTTVRLDGSGEIGSSGSAPAYKAQLYVYNDALARIQGYAPPRAFLLGRRWTQSGRGFGNNAMERLGPVRMTADLRAQVVAAAEWTRRLRTEGMRWSVLPSPSVPELRPTGTDWPWAAAASEIMERLEDPIQLWQVGPEKRDAAVRAGITSWKDPRATPESLGVNGFVYRRVLQQILDAHRDGGPIVRPERVNAARDEWGTEPPVEFFVDFEYVSALDDDFSKFPESDADPVIFMIGCGHVENGEWAFRCFIADRLDPESEARAIDEWLAHMRETEERLAGGAEANVFHWAPAEETNYETAWNSARKRHPEKDWPEVNWFDLLRKVVRAEPVVVRGAMGFGLKAVARALHKHGLIESLWNDSILDGMGAMVGAWRCGAEAAERGVRLADTELMGEIRAYNEVDCKALMEILRYLRARH